MIPVTFLILQIKRRQHEVQSVAEVTQLASGGAEVDARWADGVHTLTP